VSGDFDRPELGLASPSTDTTDAGDGSSLGPRHHGPRWTTERANPPISLRTDPQKRNL